MNNTWKVNYLLWPSLVPFLAISLPMKHVDDYNEVSRAHTWFFNVSLKTCTSSSKKLVINKTQSCHSIVFGGSTPGCFIWSVSTYDKQVKGWLERVIINTKSI
jgi:hypothetical protein